MNAIEWRGISWSVDRFISLMGDLANVLSREDARLRARIGDRLYAVPPSWGGDRRAMFDVIVNARLARGNRVDQSG
ncbi:MAG: hypothetical protein WC657_06630 [Candidatus Paceibacterota bacterium]|jgi:hypothetical protein